MPEIYIATRGAPGEKGDKGEPGTRWFDGIGPPTVVPGACAGDYYIDVETGKVYKLQWV